MTTGYRGLYSTRPSPRHPEVKGEGLATRDYRSFRSVFFNCLVFGRDAYGNWQLLGYTGSSNPAFQSRNSLLESQSGTSNSCCCARVRTSVVETYTLHRHSVPFHEADRMYCTGDPSSISTVQRRRIVVRQVGQVPHGDSTSLCRFTD